jgi:uncharacterized membrane protein YkvA (DUF1232 family)
MAQSVISNETRHLYKKLRKEMKMGNKEPVPYDDSAKGLAFLTEMVRRLRLVWQLFWDGRVPFWTKMILPMTLAYLISPVDFVPDVILGFGQLDDLGVILLGIALFVKLAPPEIVQAYLDQMEFGNLDDDEVIDTTYSVMDED